MPKKKKTEAAPVPPAMEDLPLPPPPPVAPWEEKGAVVEILPLETRLATLINPDLETTKSEVRLSHVDPMMTASASIVITDPVTYSQADEFLGKVKSAMKKVEGKFELITSPLYSAWKAATNLRAEALAPLLNIEISLKSAMAAFQMETRRLAEEVRQKLLEVQRLQNLEWERQEREKRATHMAEQGASAQQVGDMLDGKVPLNEAPPLVVSAAPVPATMPVRGQHSSTRDAWKWELVNIHEVVKAVAEGRAPLDLLTLNTTYLNVIVVRNIKDEKDVPVIPGIKFEKTVVIAGRAG